MGGIHEAARPCLASYLDAGPADFQHLSGGLDQIAQAGDQDVGPAG